ncbi:MAG: hypothetical protein WC854_12495 [Bacteroidales bacterium]
MKHLPVISIVKKIFSISFVLLMLTAMLHLSVATHYCGGKITASKISLSGKPATCGMEEEEKDFPLSGTHISSHCCDDAMVFYGINASYTPTFTATIDSYQHNFQAFSLSAGLPVNSSAVLQSLYTSASPPDALMSTNVDLSDICVFRI